MLKQCKRPLFSWVAIVAILLNALVPAMSQALERARVNPRAQPDWVEVCSTQGSTWVRLAPDGHVVEQTGERPVNAPAIPHDDHCLYCVTHAASFGLPPVMADTLPAWPLVFDLVPAPVLHARSPVAWAAPAARAPPVLY